MDRFRLTRRPLLMSCPNLFFSGERANWVTLGLMSKNTVIKYCPIKYVSQAGTTQMSTIPGIC